MSNSFQSRTATITASAPIPFDHPAGSNDKTLSLLDKVVNQPANKKGGRDASE